MKAWRIYAFGDMRLDDVPDPAPVSGSVLVKVKVAQPSVTEVVRFHGHGARRIDQFKKLIEEQAPVQLFGHEASGEVVATSEGVRRLEVGDRIAIYASSVTCGQCRFCRASLPRGCVGRRNIGQHIPGCFAEYAVLPEECLAKLPPEVSYNEGAVIQSLTSALAAVHVANIRMGDVVAVLGQGAIGLCITQLARVSGARMVIVTARRQRSVETAKLLGADVVINARETDAVDAVLGLTGGVGVDIVFDAAGGSSAEGLSGYETFFQALKIARPGGKVVEASSLVDPVTIPTFQLFQHPGISLLFPSEFARDMREYLVDLIATRRLRLGPTLTHIFNGIESVPQAFEVTGNKGKYDAINPAQVVIA